MTNKQTFLAAIVMVCTIASIMAGYIKYWDYKAQAGSPYPEFSEQYYGWTFAASNKLDDIALCEDQDGEWSAMGVKTTTEFVEGCQRWLINQFL